MPLTSRAGDAAGMRRRLDELVRQYYAPLMSFFRKRVRNAGDVQDLVQQVFLKLSRHSDLAVIEKPDAYIFQTASNAMKDYFRRDGARCTLESDLAARHHQDSDFSPERVLIGQDDITLVVKALRALPERTRDIFVLRVFEGLKHEEIARLSGISERAVQKHVARAMDAVACALGQHS